MDCAASDERLRAYLDGELSDDERAEVEGHLTGCDACRRALEEHRHVDLLLGGVYGDRDISEDSRYWGFVPADAVKGRLLIIYYSYDRYRMVPFPWITEIRWDRLLSSIR